MFFDHVDIEIQSGKGGDGCVSFKRIKYNPNAGPDGGDGGKGGSVFFQAVSSKNTLQDFRFKHHFRAEDGAPGTKDRCFGKNGEDLVIQVPVGTQIYDQETGQLLFDLDQDGEFALLARGGDGGRGNCHFANSVRQAPNFAEAGFPATTLQLNLQLKLIADVGLIGFPNAGKSTLLASLSAAKAKIASYPFTTLQPQLGVVTYQDKSFVLADLPGLIEGAAEGVGLGLEFLRHAERCAILLQVLDCSEWEGRTAIEDYEVIHQELDQYGQREGTGMGQAPKLLDKAILVVLNKIDVTPKERLAEIQEYFKKQDIETVAISAATRQGLEDLQKHIVRILTAQGKFAEEEERTGAGTAPWKRGLAEASGAQDPAALKKKVEFTEAKRKALAEKGIFEEEITNSKGEKIRALTYRAPSLFTVVRNEDGEVELQGDWIEHLWASTNFNDLESTHYFQRQLESKGVNRALKDFGIQDGDTILIQGAPLEFTDEDASSIF